MRLGAPRMGYGAKLGVGAVLLVLVVVAVVLLLVHRALERDLLSDLDLRLEAQANGAAAWATEGKHPERLAGRLGHIVGARVTILDAAGNVLGDSDGATELGANESQMPEVADALAGRAGRASRASRTGVLTRYLALPVARGMVLRLGASLEPIAATLARVRARLLVASVFGIVLALGLGYAGSQLAARPLLRMRSAAQRIAEGDYQVSLPGRSPDEFGELERSLSVLAARLSSDRARIERLEATRRDFVANVSHELRTPITAIQGYAETLLRGTADPETARRFIQTMHRQSQRVGALVTDLLRLSQAEVRLPEDVRRDPVRVADLARQAALTVREGRAVAPPIVIDVPEDVVASGDPAAVEQILENLLENAVRYGTLPDDPGEVRVRARAHGGRIALVVSDRGPGITPEHLPRIFERFYRADPAKSRNEGGTGLGLAIVKHLAESMGGTVFAESTLGRGTTFTVELHASPEEA